MVGPASKVKSTSSTYLDPDHAVELADEVMMKRSTLGATVLCSMMHVRFQKGSASLSPAHAHFYGRWQVPLAVCNAHVLIRRCCLCLADNIIVGLRQRGPRWMEDGRREMGDGRFEIRGAVLTNASHPATRDSNLQHAEVTL